MRKALKCKCRSYLYWRRKAIEAAMKMLGTAEEYAKAVEKCDKHKCKKGK